MMKIIDYVIESTNKYIKQMPKEIRKKNGQFFTSKETALFMASLFDLSSFSKEISILDPGAGSGILTAALIQRIIDTDKIEAIKITCYETNDDILELLNANLSWISKNTSLKIEYKVIKDNYITSQTLEYNNMLGVSTKPEKYDVIIGNPPYLKVGKMANEALSMPDICYGSPNLYFLFMEMASFNLVDNGELVFIVPRSWTSGAYFKKFREKFLNEVVLKHIHLFVSRDKVFDKESVLQETMII
ncbi:TPA: Eco57I restriction-modification methylase domain-containing protein, partial [Streptococcus equi subsp. equi]|nr:Eco57I restriction-modification methylase domain-containing protein [Streptococcus equi subsp. equi]